MNVGHRDVYYAKKYYFISYVWGLEFFVKKLYMYEAHISQAIITNMQIGKDPFVFEYPVTCKQKISKFTSILLKLM